MKTKLISLFALSILSLVFLVGGVSAATYTETFDNSSATGTYGDDSFLGDNGVTWNFIEAQDEDVYGISGNGLMLRDLTTGSKITSNTILGGIGSFSVQLKKGFTGVGDRQVELFINSISKGTSTVFDDTSTHTFEVNDLNIEGNVVIELRNIQDGNAQIVIDNIIWTEYTAQEELDFCSYDDGVSENPGELKVSIKDISVTEGFGDDEEWLPFDEIEVEIEVENKGDYDVDDISIEWGIADEEMDNWVIEMDEIDEFNLKDGDEEKLVITFRIDDDLDIDLDELEGSYYLYVRATGEVDDDTNPMTCASDSEAISIESESNFVILTDIESPEVVQCGADVQLTADVWNIGDRDQDDVYTIIYNKELGINEKIEIGDIDAFENEKLDVLIKIPSDAEEKTYSLKLTVYDEDNDIYENDYDDDEAIFNVYFKVEGNCGGEPNAVVSASLESGGKAGQPLVIKATVVNTGDDPATFSINAAGYADWASSAELSQSTVLLNAGDSTNVLITFNVKKDVSGEKTFNIEILSENELIVTQPVSVMIEKSGFSFTGGVISGDNWYLWGIGAINFILIIVIIFVAIRVARK